MKHRFTGNEFGRFCFRCGVFDHAIKDKTCEGKNFPNVSELDLERAENWVAQPNEMERNYFAAHAFIAGLKAGRSEGQP